MGQERRIRKLLIVAVDKRLWWLGSGWKACIYFEDGTKGLSEGLLGNGIENEKLRMSPRPLA